MATSRLQALAIVCQESDFRVAQKLCICKPLFKAYQAQARAQSFRLYNKLLEFTLFASQIRRKLVTLDRAFSRRHVGLRIEYVYLNEEQRKRLAEANHQYLLEQLKLL